MLLPLEYHFPDNAISAKRLDKMLASGYFRTGNYLMRTRVLFFNNEILNTLHIRIQLMQHEFPKNTQKVLRKNKERFRYQIQPIHISIEKELLYKEHRKRFKGNASPNLSTYLFDNLNKNIFNTYEINIYDGQRLVGFSFFDVGANSMASIIGIFDQDYASYSIGIYTMLLEIEYSKSMGLKYYYPGYVAYEPSQFNYKLRLANAFDFYDWHSKRWSSFEKKDQKVRVNDLFRQKMEIAKKWLEAFKIPYIELFYPYFYMGSMYVKSDCVKGVYNLLIQDFDIPGLYYTVEFHPEKMEIIISGVTIHKYKFEEQINLNESYDEKTWKRVLLYIHPQIVIKNELELYAAYMYLQNLFKQHLPATPLPEEE